MPKKKTEFDGVVLELKVTGKVDVVRRIADFQRIESRFQVPRTNGRVSATANIRGIAVAHRQWVRR